MRFFSRLSKNVGRQMMPQGANPTMQPQSMPPQGVQTDMGVVPSPQDAIMGANGGGNTGVAGGSRMKMSNLLGKPNMDMMDLPSSDVNNMNGGFGSGGFKSIMGKIKNPTMQPQAMPPQGVQTDMGVVPSPQDAIMGANGGGNTGVAGGMMPQTAQNAKNLDRNMLNFFKKNSQKAGRFGNMNPSMMGAAATGI